MSEKRDERISIRREGDVVWAQVNAARIEIVEGDITKQEVDAIVNAANSGLRGGGGVDGAIHRAGGPAIMAECRRLGGCPTGDAKVTTAGDLKARFVIHAVGPVYRGGRSGEPDLLASCYRRSLELASERGCRSVAFPAISCGVYGYPIHDAARIAIQTVIDYCRAHDDIELVRFVQFGRDAYEAYVKVFEEIAGPERGDG